MSRDEHQLLIEPLGVSITLSDGQTILDAALASGINLPHSCKGGSCTSCSARLLSGKVSYPHGRPMGLSADDQASGEVLLCCAQADTDLAVEVRLVGGVGTSAFKRIPCRVERLQRLCKDVMGVFLRLPAVEPLEFQPGQYVDLILEDGRRRSFSIASPPSDSRMLELHIGRIPGGEFTEAVFECLEVGTVLRLEGPLGVFCLRADSQRPWLMVAGGTGYAPIQSMLSWARETGQSRPIRFYWGVGDQQALYARAKLDSLVRQLPDFRWVPVLSGASAGGDWRGAQGLVHQAVLADFVDLSGLDVYVAGPPALVEAARRDFCLAGADPGAVYFDAFEFAPDAIAAARGSVEFNR